MHEENCLLPLSERGLDHLGGGIRRRTAARTHRPSKRSIRGKLNADYWTSAEMALERCLVEFFALQVKKAGGALIVSQNDTIKKYEKYAPVTLVNYMNSKYKGALVRFLRGHKDFFVFTSNNKVCLQPNFDAVSILVNPNNLDIVQFFLDLLQKIGATQEQPCSAHILSKYIQYMNHDARLFFHKTYGNSLNIFFTLNVTHFLMTSPDRGFVSLRRPVAASNCIAAHLRKCLHKSNAFTFSSGLSMEQLQHEGTETWLPDLRQYFSDRSRTKLNDVLNSYPNIFKWQPREKVWLRKKYEKWNDAWSSAEELLLAVHFMEMLKDIGAMSSNPICFNYILCSTQSVPQECSVYMNRVFPGIDLIDLFHLHPDKFDLSTVNCVSLKCGREEVETKRSPELLSAYYAAQLLKYAPNLTPDLLSICAEQAPKAVRTYCGSTVRHRLHTILDSGQELLANGALDCTKLIDMIKSVCGKPVFGANKNKGSGKSKYSSSKSAVSVPEKASTKHSRKEKEAPVLASAIQPEHNTPNLQALIVNVPAPALGSLTPSEPLQLQHRWPKPGSRSELKECVATSGTLVRSHSLVLIPASHSMELLPQEVPFGENCVLKLKNDSRKSVTMKRSSSFVCLALNNSDDSATKFVGDSAEAQRNSSSVQLCANAAEISAPSTSLENTNSLAEFKKQSQEQTSTVDENVEGANDACMIDDGSDSSPDYVYSKMESVLSEFIKKRLEASPTHSENFTSLHEAVTKYFGAVCSYEIHLAVLFCVGTLSFDGTNVHYHSG
ncbi:uncharacterized protein [Dermacentor andersoni]|uniref:uncharacterized protein isoform X1 n=2 Tax=Dermacentor andersoni TaxID=34620 RepID=UPI002416DCFB|nr:uncharacterized protein LOC126521625 isoform X1 [Dermacentor andersoni]